jgi:hypothetical protein
MPGKWTHGWLYVNQTAWNTWDSLNWHVAGEGTRIVQAPRTERGDREAAIEHHEVVRVARSNTIASLGQQGWELVAVEGTTMYFKRSM